MHLAGTALAAATLMTAIGPRAMAQSCPSSDEWAAAATDGIRYARAVDIDGDFLAVGDYSANSYTGRVFLRQWDGSAWGDPQVLSGAGAGESFGTQTNLSEDWIAVSVLDYIHGAVDLYGHDGVLWNYEDSYETPVGFTLEQQDLSYPWLAVAELSDDAAEIRVQMLQHDAVGDTWPVIQTLYMPADSGYMACVSLDHDMLIVGLPKADIGASIACGAVWSYQLIDGVWNALGYSTMGHPDGQYGQSVAMDATTDTMAFARHGAYESETFDDAVVNVQQFNGTSWVSEPLVGTLPWSLDHSQINSLAIDRDDLVVVLWSTEDNVFSSHHLQRSSGAWYYQSEITPIGAETDLPRYAAALDEGMVVMDGGTAATERVAWVLPMEDCDSSGKADLCEVIVPGADGNGDSVLDRCMCPGDLDFDADRDGDDIVAFLGLWAGGTAAGDLDADGEVGVLDLLVLLKQWGECP